MRSSLFAGPSSQVGLHATGETALIADCPQMSHAPRKDRVGQMLPMPPARELPKTLRHTRMLLVS